MEIDMKNDPTNTVPLQLLTIQTKDGQRWIFAGSPAVIPADPDINNAIVDVWFSNIQDVPQEASIRSLVDMMNNQNLGADKESVSYSPGPDTLQ